MARPPTPGAARRQRLTTPIRQDPIRLAPIRLAPIRLVMMRQHARRFRAAGLRAGAGLWVGIMLAAGAGPLPAGAARAQDGAPLPRSFLVGIKAVVPPDAIRIDRNIAINETFAFDPDHAPGAAIPHHRTVEADPGYDIVKAGLQVRLLTGLTRYASTIAEDRQSVTIDYAVRNGGDPDAPPAVIDAWITITQERTGGHSSEAMLLEPIRISRIGTYALYPKPDHLTGRMPFRIDYQLVDRRGESLGVIKLLQPLIVDGVSFRISRKGDRKLVLRVEPAR